MFSKKNHEKQTQHSQKVMPKLIFKKPLSTDISSDVNKEKSISPPKSISTQNEKKLQHSSALRTNKILNQNTSKKTQIDILIDNPNIGKPVLSKKLSQTSGAKIGVANSTSTSNTTSKVSGTAAKNKSLFHLNLKYVRVLTAHSLFDIVCILLRAISKPSTLKKTKKPYDVLDYNLFSNSKQSFLAFFLAIVLHFLILVPIIAGQSRAPQVQDEPQNVIEVSLIQEPKEPIEIAKTEEQQNLSWTSTEFPVSNEDGHLYPTSDKQELKTPDNHLESQSATLKKNKKTLIENKSISPERGTLTIQSSLSKSMPLPSEPAQTVEPMPSEEQKIQSALMPFIVYPQKAIEQAIEGTTILLISFNEQGVPSNISIMQSSGFSILDNAALKAAQLLPKLKDKALTSILVPVEFSIN